MPIEERKRILANLLDHPHEGSPFNEHYTGDGAIIYKQACALGCEGVVSKRLGSSYRSGRADCWVKVKNPAAPAVRREPKRLELRRARAPPPPWSVEGNWSGVLIEMPNATH